MTGTRHPRHRLDPVVHFPIRLSILAVLAEVDEAEFRFVAETVEINAVTMSKQMTILEQAGLVQVRKGYAGRRPPHLAGTDTPRTKQAHRPPRRPAFRRRTYRPNRAPSNHRPCGSRSLRTASPAEPVTAEHAVSPVRQANPGGRDLKRLCVLAERHRPTAARLLTGRTRGPVFLAERRPTRAVATVDLCPSTGRTNRTQGWTLHQLRHSILTHEAENGTNTATLLARSRHTSVRSLARYARPGPEAVATHVAATDPARRQGR